MRIPQVQGIITFKNSNIKPQESSEPHSLSKKNVTRAAIAGTGISAIIGGLIIHHNLKMRNVQELQKLVEDNLASKFPQDVNYRKNLLKAIGIPENQWFSIRSIIGRQEYKSIIEGFSGKPEAYTPGEFLLNRTQDGYKLKGGNQKTFRISLHNHTVNSDGEMTVLDLLNQAAEYADKVAQANKTRKNVPVPDAPFTIAITDHDTVEGCKEAVKIIAGNPQKYKNLRVVLGTELSVENRMLGADILTKPIQVHMVANCLNPFDKALNKFLDRGKAARKVAASQFFERLKNELIKGGFSETAAKLDIEKAEEYSPALRYGLNYPWFYMRGYVETMLTPAQKQNVTNIYNRVQKEFEPQLNLQKYCVDMEEAMNIIKKLPYGYMTFAHPALTPVGNCIKNPNDAHKNISKLISIFKEKGADRALAVELYYPYFGDTASSKEWLATITKAVADSELLPSGGLDSHGKSIFYSHT